MIVFLGQCIENLTEALKYTLKGNVRLKSVISQIASIGFDSLAICMSIVFIAACVIALQVANQFLMSGGESYIGGFLAIALIREIAPGFAALALAARAGTAICATVANMQVTDQIDAMDVLKVSPFKYLFLPRVLAGCIMMPFIVILSSAVGILAGGLTAMVSAKDVTWLCYISSVWHGLYIRDINIMLFKSACFGGCISLISSSCGYEAKGGAKGVGIATTKAVVWSFVAIVIIDCIFAVAFYF